MEEIQICTIFFHSQISWFRTDDYVNSQIIRIWSLKNLLVFRTLLLEKIIQDKNMWGTNEKSNLRKNTRRKLWVVLRQSVPEHWEPYCDSVQPGGKAGQSQQLEELLRVFK